MLAVKAERQENDRGWGTDRTDDYDGNTTTKRCGQTENYYSRNTKILRGVPSPLNKLPICYRQGYILGSITGGCNIADSKRV